MINVGDKVKIVDAGSAYPWKKELIGSTGTVDEVSGSAIAVRLDEGRPNLFPVWFARECVATEEVESERRRLLRKITQDSQKAGLYDDPN